MAERNDTRERFCQELRFAHLLRSKLPRLLRTAGSMRWCLTVFGVDLAVRSEVTFLSVISHIDRILSGVRSACS